MTAMPASRKPRGMPESLRRDLESYRLQAAQVGDRPAPAGRPRPAGVHRRLLRAGQAPGVWRPGRAVHAAQHATPAVQKEPTAAGDALEAIRQGLSLAWLHQETEAEQFQAFIGLSDKEKLDLLAYCVATSLKPQLSTGHEATAYELALSLTDADMAAYWRPTRSNYLGRITRDQLLALGRELLGDQWAQAQ